MSGSLSMLAVESDKVKLLCRTMTRAIEDATKELVTQYHQAMQPFVSSDFPTGGGDAGVSMKFGLAGSTLSFESADSVDSRGDETDVAVTDSDGPAEYV